MPAQPILSREGNRIVVFSGKPGPPPPSGWIFPVWMMLAAALGLAPAFWDPANIAGYIFLAAMFVLFTYTLLTKFERSVTVVVDPDKRVVSIARVKAYAGTVQHDDIPFSQIDSIGVESTIDSETNIVTYGAVLKRKTYGPTYLAHSVGDRFAIADIVFAICDVTKLQRRDNES